MGREPVVLGMQGRRPWECWDPGANPLGLRKAVTRTPLKATQVNAAKPHHVTCPLWCQEPFVEKGMEGLLMATPKFSWTQVSIFTLIFYSHYLISFSSDRIKYQIPFSGLLKSNRPKCFVSNLCKSLNFLFPYSNFCQNSHQR